MYRTNKKRLIPLALIPLIILISIAGYVTFKPSNTEAGWWNDNWSYRKAVTISNSGTQQTDYQVKITLDTASLISAGKMQSDCDDLRITDSDHQIIPHWVEPAGTNICNTSVTWIWTKVPTIPTTDKTIYTYYGNSGAASNEANGDDVFDYYNDIELGLDEFTTYDNTPPNDVVTQDNTQARSGTYSAKYYDNTSGSNTRTTITLPAPEDLTILKFSARPAQTNDTFAMLTTDASDATGPYFVFNDVGLIRYHNGTSYTTLQAYTANTWYDFEMHIDSDADNWDLWINGTKQLTSGAPFSNTTDIENIIFTTNTTPTNITAFVDNIAVAKLVTTPPTLNLASEETGPGPVAYWKFDEGTDNTCPGGEDTCDSTENSNDGTFSSAPAWQSEDLCIDGKCIFLDGSDDYTTVSNSSSLNITQSDPFSISAWIKHSGTPSSDAVIINKQENVTNELLYGLFVDSNLKINFNLAKQNVYADIAQSSNAISPDTWNHVIGTYDGTNLRLYVNGVLEKTQAETTSGKTKSLANINIGQQYNNAQRFKGFIDEVKIYPYARSASEILEDYNHGAQVLGRSDDSYLSEGLVGYWDMDEKVANTCPTAGADNCDKSGNGNDGSWTGTFTPAASKYGNAGYFDGGVRYADMGDPSEYDFGSNDFTVASWAYINSGFAIWDQQVIGKWNSGGSPGTNEWDLTLGYVTGTSTDPGFVIESGTTSYVTKAPASLAVNTWRHLVGTREGEYIHLYIDGELIDSTYVGNVSINNVAGRTLKMAKIDSGANGLNGFVDETRIYNRALSQDEVEKLYNWMPGPVAHYMMDEGTWTNDCSTSTVFDSSGHGNNGKSCPNSTGPTGGATGVYGKAGSFDGTDDNITIPDNDILDFQRTFAISMWVKPNNLTSTNDYLISKLNNAGTDNAYSLVWEYVNNTIEFYAAGYTGINPRTGSGITISDTDWHHITYSYDGTHWEGYKDGVKVFSITGVFTLQQTTGNLILGDFAGTGSGAFNGSIDDVRIYYRGLTTQEVVENMNAGHPAPGSPVGSALLHYKFDEGYGDTAYDSGFGRNNGDLAGTCPGGGTCPTWDNSGKFGKVLNFDGSNDYVSTTDNPSFNWSTISLSAWVKPTSIKESGIVSKGLSGSLEYGLTISSSSKYYFYVDDNGNWGPVAGVSDTEVAQPNVWVHLVATYDGSALKLYKNGALMNTTNYSGTVNNSTGALIVGAFYNIATSSCTSGTCHFNGLIDEVGIYNSALTPSQVKLLYNQGSSTVLGATGTDSNDNATWSAANEYCPPGQGTTCTPPVAEWKMDENTGTGASAVKDTSGNGNHGTMQASMTESDWVPGKKGSALEFDGSNDYVDTNNNSVHPDSITIEAWINAPSSLDTNQYLAVGKHGVNGYLLGLNNRKAIFSYNTATNVLGTSSLNDEKWHQLIGTFSGGTSKIYVDGVLEKSSAVGSKVTTSANILIGALHSDAQLFVGSLDDIRIYDYARTPAQIAWSYNHGDPVGHWKLDECQGVTAYDSSGKGNNGTITIGGTGTNTSAGTCSSGVGTETWNNGTTGKRNSSLDFDGANDYVSLPNIDLLGSYSLNAWVKFGGYSGYIIDQELGCVDYSTYSMFMNSNGTATCRLYSSNAPGGSQSVTSNRAATTGEWINASCVYDGSNLKVYVNGTEDNSISGVSPSWNSTRATFIGAGDSQGVCGDLYAPYNGQIDEVRIYNYPLTNQQIKTIYNNGAVNFGPDEGMP